MLPKEAVEEFKRIYNQRFKKDLSDAEAFRRAGNLLNLYRAIYGPASFGQIENKESYETNHQNK